MVQKLRQFCLLVELHWEGSGPHAFFNPYANRGTYFKVQMNIILWIHQICQTLLSMFFPSGISVSFTLKLYVDDCE